MMQSLRAQVEWFVPNRRVGAHVLLYDRVGSTMDVASELADAGAADGTAVLANEQTSGRGRFDRPWVGEPGGSLHLSVVLRPTLASAPLLSIGASLAVVQAVKTLVEAECTIKWPNDVRIDGKKVCGILVETQAGTDGAITAVTGIGLNLDLDFRQHPELTESATSLRAATGRRVKVEQAAAAVLEALDTFYGQALGGVDLIARWREVLDTLGQQVTVRLFGGQESGLAEDVTADGALVLLRNDGRRTILRTGEVTLQS